MGNSGRSAAARPVRRRRLENAIGGVLAPVVIAVSFLMKSLRWMLDQMWHG